MKQTYWQRLPLTSMALFLAGVFFLFGTTGVATDVFDVGRQTPQHFAVSIYFCRLHGHGSMPSQGSTCVKKFWIAFFPILAAQLFFGNLIGKYLRHFAHANADGRRGDRGPAKTPRRRWLGHHHRHRHRLHLLSACQYQGRPPLFSRAGRNRACHRSPSFLVPPIETKLGVWEFYGRSLPSGEVGGDLIDLAGDADNWVAYVADVSGHGVAPGVVMGMVKSAARMLLSSGDDATHLAPRLNEVLYPLKKPDMFVTFCFLAKTREGLRLGVSGHPAILHFSARTDEVTQYQASNMPLGILPEGEFASVAVQAEPGSLFALYTDGYVETANAAGEEYGIQRLQAEFQKFGNKPLAEIHTALVRQPAPATWSAVR